MKLSNKNKHLRGFTVLELLVAVSVTAILAGMLLNITSQVVKTQTQASGDLETSQIAHFILDRMQEDLHCAVYKNDGNVWMAASILEDKDNSGSWIEASYGKPTAESLRITPSDWSDGPNDLITQANNQLNLEDSRFGTGSTFLRFFTLAPELDSQIQNTGGARAISYQIIRCGLTSSSTSRPRYQLFRSDVTDVETFQAGYNLHPNSTVYSNGNNGIRKPSNITNPVFETPNGPSMDFSLAANIIDFGIRAYILEENSLGTSNLLQIFPDVNASTGGGNPPYQFISTSNPDYLTASKPSKLFAFPHVIDIMIRVLTSEGANALSAFEEGLIPTPSGFTPDEYWWEIAEKNSEVYTRRVKVISQGI